MARPCVGRALSLALVLACVTLRAAADDPSVDEGPRASPSDGRAALPGFVHARVAAERAPGFAVRAQAGYGFTEGVDVAAGPHHRVEGSLGISGQPLRWLGIGLSLDGRLDRHPDDGNGRDRGIVTDGMLELRATPELGHGLSVGVAAAVYGFGSTRHAFDLDALSFEASALLSRAARRSLLSVELGYRLDRSANAIPSGAVFRPGDRLSLGVSSFDAVLVRIAAAGRFGNLDLYGEAALDWLVGSGAPSFATSPIHGVLGVRPWLGASATLDFYVDVCASRRPALVDGGPYVRVDPRVLVGAAFVYRFGRGAAGATRGAPDPTLDGEATSEPPELAAERTPSAGRTLDGDVLDAHGRALVDAHVVVTVGGAEQEGYTDAAGHVHLEGIPDGEATLRIEAVGHVTRTLPLDASLALPAEGIRLEEDAPHGILRGLVRGFDGEPIAATITITPARVEPISTTDGHFEVQIPPGRYSVRIESPGLVAQTRTITLRNGEVAILNVELWRSR